MRQGLAGVAVIIMVAACGPDRGATAPAPRSPVAVQPAPPPALSTVADAAAPAAPVLLTLPPPVLEPATWVQEPMRDPDDPMVRVILVAVGTRAALATTTAGRYRIDLDHGVAGPLGPDAAWIGLGHRDQVLVADAGGRLRALEDTGEVATELSHLPGATTWDAAGTRVIAGGPEGQVWYSADGGRSFRRQSLGHAPVVQVLVRPDGGAVARLQTEGGPVTHVTRNGRSWKRSALQPQALARTGAWIHDPQGNCGAVLARGSARWVSAPLERSDHVAGTHAWYRRLDHGERPAGWGIEPATTLAVAPPRFASAREVTGSGDDCQVVTAAGLGGGGTGFGISGIGSAQTDPFRLLLGTASPPAPPTAGALHVLADGVCHRGDADPDTGACHPGAPWISRPHPVWLDREAETATVLPAPRDCRLARTDNARGLGFVLCTTSAGTELRAYNGFAYVTELALEQPENQLGDLAATDDGTIALHAHCTTRGCPVWIRAPQPGGTPEAWRQVSAPDAVTYRVVDGGAVVALEGQDRRMRFVYDPPGRPPELLTGWIEVPDGWLLLSFQADYLGLRLRVRGADNQRFEVVVTEGDRLEVVE